MKNYSIAIFGSSLRTDFDKYSDRDLLVVADDYETLKKLKEHYSKDDWSISYYTYSKLQYLSKTGSLFIKHLQRESEVFVDENERFSKILSEFNEKTDYTNDIEDSIGYFEIVNIIPKTNLGYAWFCDCLYVGLRNYLIFKNAENGTFEFSFIKLLNRLNNQGVISQSDIQILKELRVIKRNYREEVIDELPSLSYVESLVPIIKKIEILNSVKIVDPLIYQNFIDKCIIKGKFNSYQRLRLVEGYYCSQELNISELKKIISNPKSYTSKMKDDDFIIDLISEIRNATQHKHKRNNGLVINQK